MSKQELDRITDIMRQGSVDLAFLTRPVSDAQIEAMVLISLNHQFINLGDCDCGWKCPEDPADFKRFQWAVTKHIMEDIAERVFGRPAAGAP